GVQNRIYLGEAQLAGGDVSAARMTLEGVLAEARTRYGPSHALTLRAGIALAAVEIAAGHADAARDRLRPVVEALRKIGAQAQATLASALVALGDASTALHDPASATADLREAVQLRSAGWHENWELALARERLGEALASPGGAADATTEARTLLRDAATVLRDQLGPNHPETLRGRRTLARLAA
ncbi:MAG: hypothetical protein ABI624_24330, partial [Casimicrobiaceae bacterium]